MSIEAHASRIFCLMVDGSHVWSGSWDCSIKIWHAKVLFNIFFEFEKY